MRGNARRQARSALAFLVIALGAGAAAQPAAAADPTVASLALVNATSDQPIAAFAPLTSGAIINLATLPSRAITVQAFTAPALTGSVAFELDAQPRVVETVTPYALAGDDNGDFRPWAATVGLHTLRVTAYSGGFATGTAGTPLVITFAITDAPPATTPPATTPTTTPAASTPPATTPPIASPDVVRIDAGSATPTVDSLGNVWAADTGRFTPSTVPVSGTPSQAIAGTLDDVVYATNRSNLGSATPQASRALTYSIPTGASKVDVRLLFSESWWTSAGKRSFDVYAENNKAIADLDPFAAAGAANTAVSRTISGVNVVGGAVDLRFQALTDFPLIAGIEITCTAGCATTPPSTTPAPTTPAVTTPLPTTPAATTPIPATTPVATTPDLTTPPVTTPPSAPSILRVDAGSSVATKDASGNLWQPDTGLFSPANAAAEGDPSDPISGTSEYRIAATNRGNVGSGTPLANRFVDYAIPTSFAKADVRLVFAERYWSTPNMRRMDVSLEGTKVIANLDIVGSAGAKNAALSMQVPGITVSGGVLNLRLQALVDMPLISGIEIRCAAGCPTPPEPTTPAPTTPAPTSPAPTTARPWPTSWATATSSPIARFESTAVTVGSKVYAFGGFRDDAFRVHRNYSTYDLVTDRWTSLGDMPAGMAETHHGATTDGRFVYFAGGLGGDYVENVQANQVASDQVWRYDTVTNTWLRIATLPAKRAAGGLALIGRQLHWLGGISADNVTDVGDHYVFDLDSGTWSGGADMPELKDHFSTAVVDGRIYVLGGEFGHHELHQQKTSVHMYDPASDTWTARAKAPLAKSHDEGGTFVSDGKIVMAGGQVNDYFATDQVASYDPVADRWAVLAPLPAVRQGMIVQRYGSRVVITTGGVYTNTPLANTWIGSLD